MSFFSGIIAGMIGFLILASIADSLDPYAGCDEWDSE